MIWGSWGDPKGVLGGFGDVWRGDKGGSLGVKGVGGGDGGPGGSWGIGGGPRGSLPAQQPPVLSAGRSSLGTTRSGWGPPSGFPPALGTPPTADIPWGPPRCPPHPFLCAPPPSICAPHPPRRGASMCSRCRWSSTTTCPPTGRTTSTGRGRCGALGGWGGQLGGAGSNWGAGGSWEGGVWRGARPALLTYRESCIHQ